jgi:hypothetical protein
MILRLYVGPHPRNSVSPSARISLSQGPTINLAGSCRQNTEHPTISCQPFNSAFEEPSGYLEERTWYAPHDNGMTGYQHK